MYFFSVTQSFLLSSGALIILPPATRETHPSVYQCIWDNKIMLAKKCCNSTTFSIWLVYTYVFKKRSCLKMRSSTSFDITYIRWSSYIYKISSFLSFHSLLFLVNNIGKMVEQHWQSVTRLDGMKNLISKWYTFWIPPWLICCFIVIFLYIERRWLLKRNVATILPVKSKLSGKFQRFNTIDGRIGMLQNSLISKNFN